MDRKLFVGDLSLDTTEEALKEFFSQVGEVSGVELAVDRRTGKSRGYGLVTMVNEEDVEKAIGELDGKELDGRTIKVMAARPSRRRRR